MIQDARHFFGAEKGGQALRHLAALHIERGVRAGEAARALSGVEGCEHEATQVVQRLRSESSCACLKKIFDARRRQLRQSEWGKLRIHEVLFYGILVPLMRRRSL